MVNLTKPRTLQEVEKLGVTVLRKAYMQLANTYNKIMTHYFSYCHRCDNFMVTRDNFYVSNQFDSGYFPICKKCLLDMATDYNPREKKHVDNKQKTKRVLRLMDLPYDDSLYNTCLQKLTTDGGRAYSTAWQQMIVALKSLPQYKDKTYSDSDDEVSVSVRQTLEVNPEVLESGRKRFGFDFSDSDIIFLETQYADWTTRYSCENKAQQVLFQRICSTELEIRKAQKEKRDTKDLDKTLQDLMSSLSVKPSQSNSNALTEAKTFGQLIQKWEEEKPIPEPQGEFKDIDHIGRYIDVFFKGHLAKMMGLKNAFSSMYERFMAKYTVNKPTYDEDEDSEELFNRIFGEDVEE